MELHTLDGKLPMTQAHDDACAIPIASPGAHFEIPRQALLANDQRVITRRGHWRLESAKNCLPIMLDRAGLSVHQGFSAYHFAAKSRANRLMSQADPKQWHFAGEVTNQFDTDP